MISKKMEKALNGQVNKEMYSAYLYMAMSSYSDGMGLKGFANWLMAQYHEEMLHAMKIYEYITRQGGRARVLAIKEPPADFGTPLNMFKKVLEHEKFVTRSINDLVDLALAEKDHATHIFLQWYVTEQVEEEENDNDIIARLEMVGNSKDGLFMVDKDLAARQTTVPTDFSKGIESAMKAAGE
ncbi:MAG: ferritin [Chitinivibrionales bacterium]|nr:ferritin [Chitinivibrionales bacterium]MBD3396460.1 ferritin [Chitinivibrionales bacterium]